MTSPLPARNVRFHRCGDAHVLEILDEEVPPPPPGEVRIRVKAFGLNRAEILFRQGLYFEQAALPARLGYEACGVVESLGEGVHGLAPGDTVSLIPLPSLTRWGTWGEVVNLPADYLVRYDRAIDPLHSAAAWMACATAQGALVDLAKMTAGDAVVVGAASSSVGLTAIAMARRAGAVPIALTRTAEKRDRLLEAGASHVVVSDEEDVADRIRDITGGEGARIAFDPVGGPLLIDIMRGLRRRGMAVMYGRLDPRETPLPLLSLIGGGLSLHGFVFSDYVADADKRRELADMVLPGLADGTLEPVIDSVYPLSQIAQANQRVESGEQFGKIVVTTEEAEGTFQ